MDDKQLKSNQRLKRRAFTFCKRRISITSIIIGMLLGFGTVQLSQFHAVRAEAQAQNLAQLREEVNGLRAKQNALNTKWQSELFEQIVPTLTDEPEAVKRQFVDFLEEIGSSGIVALTEMLGDADVRIREKITEALGEIGENERKAGRNTDAIATGLAKALSDTAASVREEALEELDDVRLQSPQSIDIVLPVLIAMLTKDSSHERAKVLDVLGRLGETLNAHSLSTDTIRQVLIKSLTDKSTKVRTNAIEELSDIQAASTETFAALIGTLSDDSRSVRASAEEALIELGKQKDTILAPMLAHALETSESKVTRGHIVDVLGAIGAAGNVDAIVVPALLLALTDTSDDVRRNAADEFGGDARHIARSLRSIAHRT